MSEVKTENPKFFNSIQLLRGIAALCVVMTHIRFIHIGRFGVEIFFCISGFIMMHSTQKSLKGFLRKRIIRIIPLYWGFTLITYALFLLIPNAFRSSEVTIEYLLKSLFFIPYATHEGTVPVVFVGWTLNYEVLFYILFYFSTLIDKKYRDIIAGAVIMLIVILGKIFNFENVPLKFYSDPILLGFIFGMIAYRIINSRIFQIKIKAFSISEFGKAKGTRLLLYLLILLLFVFMGAIQKLSLFDHIHRIVIYGIPAFFLLLLFYIAFEGKRIFRPFIILGNISFSLFLSHYYIIYTFDRIVYPLDKTTIGSVFAALIAVAISLGVAWVIWYLFEKKLQNRIKMRHI